MGHKMFAPVEVVVWALLGGLVAALLNHRRGRACFRSRAIELSRVLVVGTLSGIALSSLALSLAPYWTLTSFLSGSDRWALAFLISAMGHRVAPIALAVLRKLAHSQKNKIE